MLPFGANHPPFGGEGRHGYAGQQLEALMVGTVGAR